MVLYTLYFKLEFGFDNEGIATMGTLLLISENYKEVEKYCLINNINLVLFNKRLTKVVKMLTKSNKDLINDYLDCNKVELLPFFNNILGPIIVLKIDINENSFKAKFNKECSLFNSIKKFFKVYLLELLNDNIIKYFNDNLVKNGKIATLSKITTLKLINYFKIEEKNVLNENDDNDSSNQ